MSQVETYETFGDVEHEFEKMYEWKPQRKSSLEWLVPGKKYRGKTYREVMQTKEGRNYLKFWRDMKPIEFPDQTEEQKRSNIEFREKHVANIDECFSLYEQFLTLESRLRGIKRRIEKLDSEKKDDKKDEAQSPPQEISDVLVPESGDGDISKKKQKKRT